MSCLCQYIADTSSSANETNEPLGFPLPDLNCTANQQIMSVLNPADTTNASADPATDDTKVNVCVSEMAKCRAENWLLKKQLKESKETLKNLENLLTTILNKQTKVLNYAIQVRQRNDELQIEYDLQRKYHTIERHALIKELYNMKKSAEKKESGMISKFSQQLGSDSEESLDTETEGTRYGDEDISSELSEISSFSTCDSDNEAEDEGEDE